MQLYIRRILISEGSSVLEDALKVRTYVHVHIILDDIIIYQPTNIHTVHTRLVDYDAIYCMYMYMYTVYMVD